MLAPEPDGVSIAELDEPMLILFIHSDVSLRVPSLLYCMESGSSTMCEAMLALLILYGIVKHVSESGIFPYGSPAYFLPKSAGTG